MTFPVGHSADAAAINEGTGPFVNTDPVHPQSTGFVLDPDGNMIVSVYSSGAIGRLVPDNVAGLSTTSSPSSPHEHNHDDRQRAAGGARSPSSTPPFAKHPPRAQKSLGRG